MWDKEPKFWSDTLTQELWKLFRENPENQQAQEGEGPSLAGWGGCLGCPGKPHCSPSLPPHLLSWRPTEELLGLVSTLGWDPQHICPTVPLPLHPCTLLGAALDPQASAGFPWVTCPLADPILSPRKTKTPACETQNKNRSPSPSPEAA